MSNFDLWENIVFGDGNMYDHILMHFPDHVEYASTSTFNPRAFELVRQMLHEKGENMLRVTSVHPMLQDAVLPDLREQLDHVNKEVISTVVDWLQDDLQCADELPVRWE